MFELQWMHVHFWYRQHCITYMHRYVRFAFLNGLNFILSLQLWDFRLSRLRKLPGFLWWYWSRLHHQESREGSIAGGDPVQTTSGMGTEPSRTRNGKSPSAVYGETGRAGIYNSQDHSVIKDHIAWKDCTSLVINVEFKLNTILATLEIEFRNSGKWNCRAVRISLGYDPNYLGYQETTLSRWCCQFGIKLLRWYKV